MTARGPEGATGPVLFARYAYPPNALGLCGPDDHRALLEYGDEGVTDEGLVRLAQGFDGAWPYLELLASVAARSGVPDARDGPLDRDVVEAYWIGGARSRLVDPAALVRSLDSRFRRRTGRRWTNVLSAAVAGLPVCHAFHVFAVYPWVGLLRSGAADQAVHVLDQCRVRWGEVVDVEGDTAVVRSRRLTWDGRMLALGAPSVEVATIGVDGRRLVSALAVGDTVALHWDWVCDRLTDGQQERLDAHTRAHLGFANALHNTREPDRATSLAAVLDR